MILEQIINSRLFLVDAQKNLLEADGRFEVIDEVVGIDFDVAQARSLWEAAAPEMWSAAEIMPVTGLFLI